MGEVETRPMFPATVTTTVAAASDDTKSVEQKIDELYNAFKRIESELLPILRKVSDGGIMSLLGMGHK